MGIFAFLRKITRNVTDDYPELRDAYTWDEHVAAGLRLELKRCPICSGDFNKHRFARFASTRIGNGNPSAANFFDALKLHNWDDLIRHQNGKETPDNAEACVIECCKGGFALLLVHTPFEPWDYASLDSCEVMKPEEQEKLKKLIREDLWKSLEKSG